ncbi:MULTISPECIES: protein disulfide isomerase family protein [Pseudanabaena]|jgi:glutaredoxin|uniref:protein disulfide isomerase family protein n=1 Tax=Pseudanabaena TaxID=1152 RepID=UPI002478FDC6|nr:MULTISPECIES: protein disulfide isomerase family protein [Pseudanabaena]MEA5488943.1 protein disulfide isomerase family protein [Pseudanabaena sp. CCNP1317]WGS70799.1 protein disulfide isomerase family protein [Pseudanabaena galeata CCNP1313]
MKFHRLSSALASVGLAIASITGFSVVTFSSQRPEAAIAQEAAPTVTTSSSANKIALAKHLRKIGAKLYTAYWCPHCHNQKQRFGKEAVKHLEVIECDRRGVKPQTQLCRDKKIRAYPTWEINGKLYPGNHSLESIANFSQYRGNL